VASIETLRFVLFGDDRASSVFDRFARSVGNTTGAIDKNNLSLETSKLKIEDITKRAEELGRLHPNLKVEIDDAAAKLKLAVLRHDIRSTLSNPSGSVGGGGLLGWIGAILGSSSGGAGGGASGLAGLIENIPKVGGAFAALGPAAGPALAVIIVALAGVATALTPVLAALLPVTLGFATLAVVVGKVGSDLNKFFSATSAKQKREAWAALDPAERHIADHIDTLKKSFGGLMTAVEPSLVKAFDEALVLIQKLLPTLKPLAVAAAKAVAQFVHELVDWLDSPSGKSFLHWLQTVGPKDIKNFGRVLWDVAHTVGDALHWIYEKGSEIDRFLTRWGDDWKLVKDVARLQWDQIKVSALNLVFDILNAFTKIPIIGSQFKSARDSVKHELDLMKTDAFNATNDIQSDWDRIHGRKVNIEFTSSFVAAHGVPVAPAHTAAGGLISGGTPGRDSVPILAMPGEVVVPTHMVRSGAVDHLRGRLPGFARGGQVGGWDFTESFVPSVKTLIGRINSGVDADEAAMRKYVQSNPMKFWKFVFPGAGGVPGGGGPGGPVEAVARALFPWAASQWPSFNAVEMREAGYNLTAQNPSSGAYGVAQFINGPSEYFQWGGSPFTAAGQFTAMFNYIRSRYGVPSNAWAHEVNFGWYDHGGMLPPGLSLAYNGTGKPEQVGGGGIVIHNLHVTAQDPAALVRGLQNYAESRGGIKLKIRN
jgi:hypothetical protein